MRDLNIVFLRMIHAKKIYSAQASYCVFYKVCLHLERVRLTAADAPGKHVPAEFGRRP